MIGTLGANTVSCGAMTSLAMALVLSAACSKAPLDPPTAKVTAEEAPLDPAVAATVDRGNERIVARQRAVKSWSTITVPSKDAKACAATPAIKTSVDGFGLGSSEARKTMVIVSADEIAGKPDPSFPPELAKDLAQVKAAARGAKAPLRWATMDYTTDDFPFDPGPRAKAFQFAFGSAKLKGATAQIPQSLDELTKDEVILVATQRTRTQVEGKTFAPGSMSGIALLYSYEKGRVVCAGRFDATNAADEFRGTKGQIERMPEEELEVVAFRSAAANLRDLPSP